MIKLTVELDDPPPVVKNCAVCDKEYELGWHDTDIVPICV